MGAFRGLLHYFGTVGNLGLNPIRPHDGTPEYLEQYRAKDYVPPFSSDNRGCVQISSPETPYVAAVGRTRLFFLDTRFDSVTAQRIKTQLEHRWLCHPESYIFVDTKEMKVEERDSQTDKTLFTWDTVFATLLFAEEFNKVNTELNLPEYELYNGDWVTDYSEQLKTKLGKRGVEDGCLSGDWRVEL